MVGVHFYSIGSLIGSDCTDYLLSNDEQLPEPSFIPDQEGIYAIYCTRNLFTCFSNVHLSAALVACTSSP